MLSKLKQFVSNDLVERALWTALQAGLAAWAVTGYQLNKAAAAAVLGTVLSALKTFVKERL